MAEIDAYLSYESGTLRGKRAFVTGASSGIGLATTCALAAEGVDLVLMARREDRLVDLKSKLLRRFPDLSVDLFPADVRDASLTEALYPGGTHHALAHVDILINNAGLARGAEHAAEANLKDWQEMLDTNVWGLVRLTHTLLPHLLSKGTGHIVNIGSLAGHVVYEGGSVYCASKHAVHAFSKALRLELYHRNIRVSLVSPGMVDTEFSTVRYHGDSRKAAQVYEGMKPLQACDIAQQIIFCLKQPAHVNIDEILILPTAQGGAGKVHRAAK